MIKPIPAMALPVDEANRVYAMYLYFNLNYPLLLMEFEKFYDAKLKELQEREKEHECGSA